MWPYGLDTFKDRYFTREAADFLRDPPQQPWALFVCLWAPHPTLGATLKELHGLCESWASTHGDWVFQ